MNDAAMNATDGYRVYTDTRPNEQGYRLWFILQVGGEVELGPLVLETAPATPAGRVELERLALIFAGVCRYLNSGGTLEGLTGVSELVLLVRDLADKARLELPEYLECVGFGESDTGFQTYFVDNRQGNYTVVEEDVYCETLSAESFLGSLQEGSEYGSIRTGG